MRRITQGLLIVTVVLAMSGCGGSATSDSARPTTARTSSPTPTPTLSALDRAACEKAEGGMESSDSMIAKLRAGENYFTLVISLAFKSTATELDASAAAATTAAVKTAMSEGAAADTLARQKADAFGKATLELGSEIAAIDEAHAAVRKACAQP